MTIPLLKKGPHGYEQLTSEEIASLIYESEVIENLDEHPARYRLFQKEQDNPSLRNLKRKIDYQIGIDFMTNQPIYKMKKD